MAPSDSPPRSSFAVSPFAPAPGNARHVRIGPATYRVYLRELPVATGGRRPALVFESDSVIRVVRRFPEHWATLTDEELGKLSWER